MPDAGGHILMGLWLKKFFANYGSARSLRLANKKQTLLKITDFVGDMKIILIKTFQRI